MEVLRDLGFEKAMGIDLNPGEDNPWVNPGTSCISPRRTTRSTCSTRTAWTMRSTSMRFFKEHARAIKPDGYVLYELGTNMEGGGGPFEAVAWERTERCLPKNPRRLRPDHLRGTRDDEQALWVL